MKNFCFLKLLLFMPLVIANSSMAAVNSSTTKATASMSSSCVMTSSDINFGAINLFQDISYGNGMIQVKCTRATTYSILMTYKTPNTRANYLGGKALTGLMTGIKYGDQVNYALQSIPIDNNKPSWAYTAYNGTGTGTTQSITVYGEVQLGVFGVSRYPTPDTYTDSATASITY